MIFLLIAGTATPAFLIAAHGIARLTGLIAIWTLTLTAGAIHMAWTNAPERLVGGTFVALGWVAGLALPAVWLHSRPAAGALMFAGGVLYTAGALSYHRRWPNPLSEGFRLPRGLSRLRLRRCGVPVHGDSAVHRLNLPVRALFIPNVRAVSTHPWHLAGVGRAVSFRSRVLGGRAKPRPELVEVEPDVQRALDGAEHVGVPHGRQQPQAVQGRPRTRGWSPAMAATVPARC
jgi:predicted membrane channel-forming protein YqfA (hemolysin III family)